MTKREGRRAPARPDWRAGTVRAVAAPGAATADGGPRNGTHLWRTRRALLLHLTLVVVVPAFVGLFWWQVQRVREGNTLSWAYVFEWPIFTAYAVYLWWKLLHDQIEDRADTISPRRRTAKGPRPKRAPVSSSVEGDEGGQRETEELAAYNRYLAELNASGRRKSW